MQFWRNKYVTHIFITTRICKTKPHIFHLVGILELATYVFVIYSLPLVNRGIRKVTKVGHIIEAPYYDRNGNFYEKLEDEDEDNDFTDDDNFDNIDDSNSDDD